MRTLKKLLAIVSALSVLVLSIIVVALATEDKAKLANENPFYNGELNVRYEGELTALAGRVISIKSDSKGREFYQIDLRLKGINHLWVSGITPFAEGDIKLGDELIFRGYIASSNSLDPSGEIRRLIGTHTLLLVLKAQLP